MVRIKHPITNEIMSVRGAESFWAVNPENGKKSKYLINDYRLDGKGTPNVLKPDPKPAEKLVEKPAKPTETIAETVVIKPTEKPEDPPAIEMPPDPPKEPKKSAARKYVNSTKPKKSWFEGEWFY